MKAMQLVDAKSLAIPVKNCTNDLVGRLVPVGPWLLDDTEMVETIKTWRNRFRRMFLVQLETSYQRTFDYLKNCSIGQKNQLLFLLFDNQGQFIGHLGISKTTESSCELDNFMRGASGGSPRLIYFAELALLNWCFTTLDVSNVYVGVLSYNFMAIDLHTEVGFSKIERKHLKKMVLNDTISHAIVDSSDANVHYQFVEMCLQKDTFQSKYDYMLLFHS